MPVTPLIIGQLPETTYEGISVGDLVTAYYAGYHIVTGFHMSSHATPIQIDLKTVASATGKRFINPRARSCALTYCKKVDRERVNEMYLDELNELKDRYHMLYNLLKEVYNG